MKVRYERRTWAITKSVASAASDASTAPACMACMRPEACTQSIALSVNQAILSYALVFHAQLVPAWLFALDDTGSSACYKFALGSRERT